MNLKLDVNLEKRQIINTSGNILVTANPGTGKTFLLACKYISLINKGVKPENVLCLTYTEKAKTEMRERILNISKEVGIDLDVLKLNVNTFHSYALGNLNSREIISSNLLRFSIYTYVKKKNIFNYADPYILQTLVPKIENLIRYLKSFGILPEQIDKSRSRELLPKNEKVTRDELENFLEEFIKIYKHYEEDKKRSEGYDYADLLIEFLKLDKKPRFDYVLVDELQDVNKMEADIALGSGDNFIAVGDKKQAIFGFQGGSISNFELFKDSSHFVLSENFRSTNQILKFAREYFISKTKNDSHQNELEDLLNPMGLNGDDPTVIEVKKENTLKEAIHLLAQIADDKKTTAVILRTNHQIDELGKQLDKFGIDFSITLFSGSEDARKDIINFLKGILSKEVSDVKNAMFTPYFPISIQDAFEFADRNYDTLDNLLSDLKEFKNLRDGTRNKYDLIELFENIIIPISIPYGKQYYFVAEKMREALIESWELLGNKTLNLLLLENGTLNNIFAYLGSCNLTTEDVEDEKPIILTTIHKAKGREFDNVIYVPSVPKDQKNFIDDVVKSILSSKGINTEEELEEEFFRINFVAFTRAREKLFIITHDGSAYKNY